MSRVLEVDSLDDDPPIISSVSQFIPLIVSSTTNLSHNDLIERSNLISPIHRVNTILRQEDFSRDCCRFRNRSTNSENLKSLAFSDHWEQRKCRVRRYSEVKVGLTDVSCGRSGCRRIELRHLRSLACEAEGLLRSLQRLN